MVLDASEAAIAAGLGALLPLAVLGGLVRSRVARLEAELRARMEELRASRARLVESADVTRRRLERDLHDGAQSRLVAIALLLHAARTQVSEGDDPDEVLEHAERELRTSMAELRELARGLHPAVLSQRGLEPAVKALGSRAPLPVAVDASGGGRLPLPVESAAYFVVSEGLANVAKYAHATRASVRVERVDGHLSVEIADDGIGGADAGRGTGLRGLEDRVAALDGVLSIQSPAGRGTRLHARIPLRLGQPRRRRGLYTDKPVASSSASTS